MDGHIQFPQQQDCLKYGTLMIAVETVSILGIDEGRLEQSDFIVPHQGFFVDAMQDRKLADCE